mmetsp:Transcript_7405/g.11862  ORF Transcript_7405/g.11862 Transcript_7405/m.11862 type:complete len:429 (+) Transcript_7405:153-1439(+)
MNAGLAAAKRFPGLAVSTRPVYAVRGVRHQRFLATGTGIKKSIFPDVQVNTIRPGVDFELSSKEVIPKEYVQIKYSTMGDKKNPAIFICPSMSNSVHVTDDLDENGVLHHGWWRKVVGHGPSYGIDLDKFYVICGAPMGSPFGSTSPLTKSTNEMHEPLRSMFPEITPRDQAFHQKLLLDTLGIDKVFAIVGGSMGGMQVLQFAVNFPEVYERFFVVASTAQTSPATVALRSVQRAAVRMDPDFMHGYYDTNPTKGMGIARMFGTICYRSPVEFDERFKWDAIKDDEGNPTFEVETYLEHQATKFTTQTNYDANCYMLLSQSMDLMNIAQGFSSYDNAASRIKASSHGCLLSYSTDRLTPAKDLERLGKSLGNQGVSVYCETLESKFGHDAFLIQNEAHHLNVRLKPFLEDPHPVHAVSRLVKDLHGH